MPGAEVYSLTQNESLKLAAEKLAEIHLAFWQGRFAYANALQQLHGSSMLTRRRQQAYKNSCSRKAWKDFSDKVMERLQDVPKTLIHGDLFPSNILIDEQNVCFVDWADAAISGDMMDIARLTATIDIKTMKPMCPCEDEIIRAYYNKRKDRLAMNDSDYLRDIHAAQFIELCNSYQPMRAFGVNQKYNELLEQRIDRIVAAESSYHTRIH